MKKLLAILLALSMIISLAACGSDSDDDRKSKKKDKDEVAEEIVDENNENDDESYESAEVEKPTEGKKPDKNNKPDKDESKTISRGKIKGNVYTNDYLDLTFTKPDSWYYLSDEELATVVGASIELFENPERFEQALESQASVYDFMVVDPVTGTNLMLCYENLKNSNSAGMSEAAYITAVEYQLTAQTAMTVERMGDNKVVELGGEEYVAALYRSTVGDQSFVQIYYVRSMGDYMCSFVVTLKGGYDYNDVEAMFS